MRMTEEQYQELLMRRVTHQLKRLPIASPAASQKARKQKYGNRKVTDGEGNKHDSSKEYRHWCELQLREMAGEITQLCRQLPIACVVNDVLVCHWIADYVYVEGAATIYEDCKSPPTRKKPDYRLKRKLVAAIHGIDIREV